MTVLSSTLDTTSDGYAEAVDALLCKLNDLDTEVAKALAGGGEKYTKRHNERGKLTARERIELKLRWIEEQYARMTNMARKL